MTDWLDEFTRSMPLERARYWRDKAADECLEAQWDAAAAWWASLSPSDRADMEARERELRAEFFGD